MRRFCSCLPPPHWRGHLALDRAGVVVAHHLAHHLLRALAAVLRVGEDAALLQLLAAAALAVADTLVLPVAQLAVDGARLDLAVLLLEKRAVAVLPAPLFVHLDGALPVVAPGPALLVALGPLGPLAEFAVDRARHHLAVLGLLRR